MKQTIKHVFRRGSAYRYRRRVPQDVQKHTKKREWVFGIGTEIGPAIARAKALDEQIERFIVRCRHGETSPTLTLSLPAIELGRSETSIQHRLVSELTISKAVARDQELYSTSSNAQQSAALSLFVSESGDLSMSQIQRVHVMAFVEACLSKGHKPSSIRRRLGAMAAVVNRYHQDFDIVRRNHFSRVPLRNAGPKASDKEPLDQAQVRTLDEFLKSDQITDPHLLSVFWLIRCSTLGPSEAGGLTAKDIVGVPPVLHVSVQPNARRPVKAASRRRNFPIVGPAAHNISHLIDERAFDSKTLSNKLNLALKRALPNKRDTQSVYSLRHNWKDWLVQAGASQDETRYLMGHATRTPHERYGAATPDLSRLKTLVERAYAISTNKS